MEENRKISAGNENILVIPIEGHGAISLMDVQLSDYYGSMVTPQKSVQPILPGEFALHQNYPNPFNAVTQIVYELPAASHVEIDVINAAGQKVISLIDAYESAGVHRDDAHAEVDQQRRTGGGRVAPNGRQADHRAARVGGRPSRGRPPYARPGPQGLSILNYSL